MHTSVIIPCHGNVEDTRRCLEGLAAQQGAGELEILIVDNASGDGTAELGREVPGVRVLRQTRNLGFGAGVNRGLQAAQGELLLVLNNDTRPAPSMIARLQRALLADARIAAAAPVSNHVKGPAQIAAGGRGDAADVRATEAALGSHAGGMVQDLESLAGLCMLLRRETLQRVGGFDERFRIGNYEDDDLCLRARLLGYRLVVARDAFLHHHGHRTFQRLGLDYRAELLAQCATFAAKWRVDPAGRAVLALLDGDLRRAEGEARAARMCHPRWPDAHWILARAAVARGEDRAARAYVEAFLDACPQHTGARLALVAAALATGDEEGARAQLAATLRDCHVLAPEAAAMLAQLARLELRAGRAKAAAETAADALALAPEDGELLNLVGAALLEAGAPERALPALIRAAQLGHAHGATNLGLCRWRMGDLRAGLAQLEAAASSYPDDPVVQGNLQAARAGIITAARAGATRSARGSPRAAPPAPRGAR